MFTLRTLPLVFDIVRDIEALCPRALFINFSNPENRIIHALGKYTNVSALGLCHGIFMSHGDVAHMLGRKYEDIDVWGAGLNHSQCLMQIRDRSTNKNHNPQQHKKEKT